MKEKERIAEKKRIVHTMTFVHRIPRATRRCVLLLLLVAIFSSNEDTVSVQYVLAKEESETVSSADDVVMKAGESGTTHEVGAEAPPVATPLPKAIAEESNEEKEKEYAERRSKVYARVEFASLVLQMSPLENEFCIYDVQKEGADHDKAGGEKNDPVPLLKKREKTEREVLPSLKAYKTSVQEQLQQKRALERKAKKATKSGENNSMSSEQQPVVDASSSEKTGGENMSTFGEEEEESTKFSGSISEDSTPTEEKSASSSSSSTTPSDLKASNGDEKSMNEKTNVEKTEKAQIENKKTPSSGKSLKSNNNKEMASKSGEDYSMDDGVKKEAEWTELAQIDALEKSEESETFSSDVNAASSESTKKEVMDAKKNSADEDEVVDAKENKSVDREQRSKSNLKEEEEEEEEGEDDDDDVANQMIHPQSVTKEDREKYNLASVGNGAKVISSNEESKHASSMLSEDMDSYYISPCNAASKWVTVELSEEATLTQVIVADYEFHSSGMHKFEIWGTDGHHSDEEGWKKLATCEASRSREPQKFSIPANEWVRYVQLRFLTHFGSHHFCTVSLFRVHGKDAKETLREEMERIQEEVEEVEQLFRETDETEEAEAAASLEEGENNSNNALDNLYDADSADVADTVFRDENRYDDEDIENTTDIGESKSASTIDTSTREGKENSETMDSSSSSLGESVTAKNEKKNKVNDEKGNTAMKETSPKKDMRAADNLSFDTKGSSGKSSSSSSSFPSTYSPSPSPSPPPTNSANATTTTEVPETPAMSDENSNASSTGQMKSLSSSLSNQTKSSENSLPSDGSAAAATAAAAAAAVAASQPGGGGKGSENVFRKLAQKVKDLELNQSVLDRYIESLNERYAGALNDLNKEIDEIAAVVTNSSNALNEAARRMENSVSKCDKETERQADRFTKSEHALMGAMKEFENSRAQARRRENVVLSFMFVILTGMVWNATGLRGISTFKRASSPLDVEEVVAEEMARESPPPHHHHQQQQQQQHNDLRRVHLSSPDFATHAFRENLFFE